MQAVAVRDTAHKPQDQTQENPLLGLMCREYQRAKQLRQPWEPLFQECYDYALPQRDSFFVNSDGAPRGLQIYDDTAVVGLQELSARVQTGMFPIFGHWMKMEAGAEVPRHLRNRVQRQLDDVTHYAFEVIQDSNFSQEMNEALQDYGCSTGALAIERGDHYHPVSYTHIPLPQLFLRPGPDGRPDGFFRSQKMRIDHIEAKWPGAQLPESVRAAVRESNGACEFEVVVAVTRDWSVMARQTWQYLAFLPKEKAILGLGRFDGFASQPITAFRWSSNGGIYGRGAVMNVMPSVKTVNLVKQLVLENAELAITGMWQGADDGILNPDQVQLFPGAILSHGLTSQGLKPLETPGNFDVASIVLQEERDSIKRGLYNTNLGPLDRTPRSAAEVMERMADLSRVMGPTFGRLQAEASIPIFLRTLHVLHSLGKIDLPVLAGRVVKARVVSPLAKQQNYEDVNQVDRALELVGLRFGPQMVNILFRQEKVATYYAERLGLPADLVRSEDEMQQLAAQVAQLSQNPSAAQAADDMTAGA